MALSAISQKVITARKLLYEPNDFCLYYSRHIKTIIKEQNRILAGSTFSNTRLAQINRYLNELQNIYDEIAPAEQLLGKIYNFMKQMPVK